MVNRKENAVLSKAIMLPVTIDGQDYLINGDAVTWLSRLGNVIIEKSNKVELNTPASRIAQYLADGDQFCLQLFKEYDTEETNIMTDSILDAIKASGALDEAPETQEEKPEQAEEKPAESVEEPASETQEPTVAETPADLFKALEKQFDDRDETIKNLTSNKNLNSQLKTLSAVKTDLEENAKKLSAKNDDLTAKLKLVTPVLLDDDEAYINGLDLSNDQKKAAAIFNLVTGAMTTAASGKTVDPTRFVNMVLAVSSRHAD